MYSTNYKNVFKEIADDCPILEGEFPAVNKSVANLQFEMLNENPYKYISDDVLYGVFVIRKEF
jgi:hypothetical protein